MVALLHYYCLQAAGLAAAQLTISCVCALQSFSSRSRQSSSRIRLGGRSLSSPPHPSNVSACCLCAEYRVQAGELEYWLVSPSERVVRVELVPAANRERHALLRQLCTLRMQPIASAGSDDAHNSIKHSSYTL